MDQKVEQPVEASLIEATSANYIEKALAHAYNSESLRVESFHSEAITQTGENFCSHIYRLKLTYRKSENAPLEHGSFIVKDLIPIMAALGSNEKLMFEEVLPAMAQVLDKAPSTLGDKKLSADCLFIDRTKEKELYLLEDLGALGYVTLNRFIGLSAEDARLCLRKLAQFHAASMVVLDEQPSLVADLAPSHYAKGLDDALSHVIILDGTEYGADVVDGLGMSSIAAKMRAQLPDEYSKRISAVVDPKNSPFSVICHGDIWVNNMMINQEERKAIIVDFQCCYVASPAVDLQFFFYTSLQLDVLLHQRENLLKYYYECLCETLTACNYRGSMPSYDQLLEEMQRCLFYGYYAAVCELPICCASKDASKDFTAHTFGDAEAIKAKRHQLFDNERVRQTLQATLGHFEEQGILETL
ncbi:hypothetical protein ACLKA6_002759 [Drosophila palustris]